MRNHVTATPEPIARGAPRPRGRNSHGVVHARFADALTGAVKLAITAVDEPLVRSPVGVFAPAGELL
jgi:hypothetical protein